MRPVAPFLLDIQNDYIDQLQSRVVIALRLATKFGPPMRDLNPVFTVAKLKAVLDTAANLSEVKHWALPQREAVLLINPRHLNRNTNGC
jgi:CcdB protein